MNEREEPPVHPNLADALDGDTSDTDGLAAIAGRLADLGPDAVLESPPPGLFAAIEAQVTKDAAAAAPLAAVVPMAPWRRRAPWLAAAAAVVVAGLTTAMVVGGGDDEPTVEEVALGGLEGFEDASGVATVVIDGSARSVAVDLRDIDVPAGSHLELWLLDEPVAQLVALGELSGDGPHQIPGDVDLDATPIVDVSLEPDDGDPAHSGVSVVRGTIVAS